MIATFFLSGIQNRHSYMDSIYYRTKSNLTEIPDDIPNEAREVHLHGNKISVVTTFNDLLLCEMLDLSNNNISQIHDDAFLSLRNLKKLYLGKNLLGTLTAHQFNGLQSLEVLDLSDNPLVSIAPCAFAYFPQPFRLGINSIKMCDYRWCWVKQRIRNGTIILLYEEITCSEGSWQDTDCTSEGMADIFNYHKRMHSSRMRTARSLRYRRSLSGGGRSLCRGISVRGDFCAGRSPFRGTLSRGSLAGGCLSGGGYIYHSLVLNLQIFFSI